MEPNGRATPGGSVVLGVLFIAVGVFVLAGQVFDLQIGRYGWPLFVIVPGLVLLALGLRSRGGAAALVIPGSVTTAAGVLLAYQNTFDHFESWAYAWALVAPGALGVGLRLFGQRLPEPRLATNGGRLALLGLGLFAVGLLFYEGVIGISGRDLGAVGEFGLPVALILAGLALLVLRRKSSKSASGGGGQ